MPTLIEAQLHLSNVFKAPEAPPSAAVTKSASQVTPHDGMEPASSVVGTSVPAVPVAVPVAPPPPRALAALKAAAGEATQHPLLRFAGARAVERQIGLLAPQSPHAHAAASKLLDLVHHFLRHELGMDEAQVLKTLTGRNPSRAGSVRSEDVQEAMQHGNLREKLALVDLASKAVGSGLLQIGAKAAADPAYCARLQKDTALRMDLIVQKHFLATRLGGNRSYDSLVLDPHSPLQRLPSMRSNRSIVVFNRSTGAKEKRLTHDVTTRHQTGRRGVNFDEHTALPLSEREKRNLFATFMEKLPAAALGAHPQEFKDFHSIAHARLNLTEGAHGKQPNLAEPWMADAAARGLPVSAGISGSTYRFMSLFHDLGGSKQQLVHMRLACLAFLVPSHHSYHEVMASAAEYEACQYDPEVHTAAKLVESLQAESAASPARPSNRALFALASDPGTTWPQG